MASAEVFFKAQLEAGARERPEENQDQSGAEAESRSSCLWGSDMKEALPSAPHLRGPFMFKSSSCSGGDLPGDLSSASSPCYSSTPGSTSSSNFSSPAGSTCSSSSASSFGSGRSGSSSSSSGSSSAGSGYQPGSHVSHGAHRPASPVRTMFRSSSCREQSPRDGRSRHTHPGGTSPSFARGRANPCTYTAAVKVIAPPPQPQASSSTSQAGAVSGEKKSGADAPRSRIRRCMSQAPVDAYEQAMQQRRQKREQRQKDRAQRRMELFVSAREASLGQPCTRAASLGQPGASPTAIPEGWRLSRSQSMTLARVPARVHPWSSSSCSCSGPCSCPFDQSRGPQCLQELEQDESCVITDEPQGLPLAGSALQLPRLRLTDAVSCESSIGFLGLSPRGDATVACALSPAAGRSGGSVQEPGCSAGSPRGSVSSAWHGIVESCMSNATAGAPSDASEQGTAVARLDLDSGDDSAQLHGDAGNASCHCVCRPLPSEADVAAALLAARVSAEAARAAELARRGTWRHAAETVAYSKAAWEAGREAKALSAAVLKIAVAAAEAAAAALTEASDMEEEEQKAGEKAVPHEPLLEMKELSEDEQFSGALSRAASKTGTDTGTGTGSPKMSPWRHLGGGTATAPLPDTLKGSGSPTSGPRRSAGHSAVVSLGQGQKQGQKQGPKQGFSGTFSLWNGKASLLTAGPAGNRKRREGSGKLSRMASLDSQGLRAAGLHIGGKGEVCLPAGKTEAGPGAGAGAVAGASGAVGSVCVALAGPCSTHSISSSSGSGISLEAALRDALRPASPEASVSTECIATSRTDSCDGVSSQPSSGVAGTSGGARGARGAPAHPSGNLRGASGVGSDSPREKGTVLEESSLGVGESGGGELDEGMEERASIGVTKGCEGHRWGAAVQWEGRQRKDEWILREGTLKKAAGGGLDCSRAQTEAPGEPQSVPVPARAPRRLQRSYSAREDCIRMEASEHAAACRRGDISACSAHGLVGGDARHARPVPVVNASAAAANAAVPRLPSWHRQKGCLSNLQRTRSTPLPSFVLDEEDIITSPVHFKENNVDGTGEEVETPWQCHPLPPHVVEPSLFDPAARHEIGGAGRSGTTTPPPEVEAGVQELSSGSSATVPASVGHNQCDRQPRPWNPNRKAPGPPHLCKRAIPKMRLGPRRKYPAEPCDRGASSTGAAPGAGGYGSPIPQDVVGDALGSLETLREGSAEDLGGPFFGLPFVGLGPFSSRGNDLHRIDEAMECLQSEDEGEASENSRASSPGSAENVARHAHRQALDFSREMNIFSMQAFTRGILGDSEGTNGHNKSSSFSDWMSHNKSSSFSEWVSWM